MPSVWVGRAGERGIYADDFERLECAAIGYNPVGDLSGLDRDQIMELARAGHGSNGGRVGGQLDSFKNRIATGDLIVTPNGQTRQLLYGEVTSDYRYSKDPVIADFRHLRHVHWLGKRDRDPLPSEILYSFGGLQTVFSPKGQDALRAFLLEGIAPADDVPGEEGGELEQTSVEEQGSRNRELIARHIARLGPYEAQDVVAGVLRAMGYVTQVSPPGADGGVDVVASRDPLFLHPPLLTIQVKARPDTKIAAGDVRELLGVVRPDERAIFVSTGGFTSAAEREFQTNPAIQLIGMDRLLDLLLDHYEQLDDETRDLVPLRRIWVLGSGTVADDADQHAASPDPAS